MDRHALLGHLASAGQRRIGVRRPEVIGQGQNHRITVATLRQLRGSFAIAAHYVALRKPMPSTRTDAGQKIG
jgi:hypothetical protein